ncbi:GNAT family N-acetyltransferase [Vibrio sp. DNF-1]|nr:GNAT family N-acetyltransferase [Vibrio salinus]
MINYDKKIAEADYLLAEHSQGKGYASESLCAITEYAFNELSLNKVIAATCSTENISSYHLLKKQGFVKEKGISNKIL